MNNKHLLIVVIVLIPLAVISFKFKKKETNFILQDEVYGPVQEEKYIEPTIRVKIKNEVKTLDLEDYIIGVVAGEMPASFASEALKAQAVASRSYALYKKNNSEGSYDLTADVSTQVYLDEVAMMTKWGSDFQKYRDKIAAAVEETKGEVLTYDGQIIEAFYFAMSAGNTNEAASVFGEDRSYLKSVISEYDDESLTGYRTTSEFSHEDFKNKLNLACDEITIDEIKRNTSDYIDEITICSKTFKGTQFRSMLNLRSTNFTISLADVVAITTQGYGHGVGLSQYGANGYANHGYTYEDILKHYYTDVEIKNLKDV